LKRVECCVSQEKLSRKKEEEENNVQIIVTIFSPFRFSKKGNRCEMGQAGEKNLIEAKDVGVCVFKKKRGGGRGGKKTLPFLVMLGLGVVALLTSSTLSLRDSRVGNLVQLM